MIDYNFYNIKIFKSSYINNNYNISVYCNNYNYYEKFTKSTEAVMISPVMVPKYTKSIYLQFQNIYNDQIAIFYVPNKVGNFRLNINNDTFYIKLQESINIPNEILKLPKENTLDQNNLYIYHNELKTIIPEIVNSRWSTCNYYLSQNGINQYFRKMITKLMGYFLQYNFSNFLIEDFIKNYNINISKFSQNYNSFNDFFVRKLLIPPQIIKEPNYNLRSPTTSRIMTFDYFNPNTFTTWIKGSEFSIPKLINDTVTYNIQSIMICRLAVQDYHHFHMPYTGTLEDIKILGTDYYSVQPKLINSSINILTENYRHIYRFKATNNLNQPFQFWLIPIGALIAGSIEHNLIVGNTYYSGERIGNFSLGGSTVVILSTDKFIINEDIKYYSEQGIETYVKVGDVIGGFSGVNPIKYPNYYNIESVPSSNEYNLSDYSYLLKYLFIIFIFYLIIKIYYDNSQK